MIPTFDFAKALEHLRYGQRVTRSFWINDHRSLILIPGREITVSYAPMNDHMGDGTTLYVHDHIDAIYDSELPTCVVGYQFLQDDILACDWLLWSDLEKQTSLGGDL